MTEISQAKTIKNLPKNEIWVPGCTEVLTIEGWAPVADIFHSGIELMSIDLTSQKVERHKPKGLSQRPFKGKLTHIEGECGMTFKTADLIQKHEVFKGFPELPSISHEIKMCNFQGELYSFTIPGAAFLRSTLIITKVNDEYRATPDRGKLFLLAEECSLLADDVSIFTQDDYEEGECDYVTAIEGENEFNSLVNNSKMSNKTRKILSERKQEGSRVKKLPTSLPDYWMSLTRW